MKQLYLATLLIFGTMLLHATDKDSISPGWGTLNYNVEQTPAFSILGISPDNIVKPTSARNIAVNIGNYYMNNGLTIPQNMAVEISPFLMSPDLSLYKYSQNPFLYRLRFSIATKIADNGTYHLAEGIRLTLIDKTDLRTDEKFINEIYKSSLNEARTFELAFSEYIRNHPEEDLDQISAGDLYDSDENFRNKIDLLMTQLQRDDYMSINKIREKRTEELWNAEIWELGLAALQHSPDSTLNKIKMSQIKLWSTYGTGLGKHGQLLMGCNFELVDSSAQWLPKLSVGSRLYYGKNDLRYFVQAEYSHINQINDLTCSTGLVFNISAGIWAQFGLNLIYDFKGNMSFVPGINLGLALAGKKNQ